MIIFFPFFIKIFHFFDILEGLSNIKNTFTFLKGFLKDILIFFGFFEGLKNLTFLGFWGGFRLLKFFQVLKRVFISFYFFDGYLSNF